MVYRVYVEKKAELAHEANGLLSELNNLVGIKGLTSVRVLNRYDVEGLDPALFEKAVRTIFSEPQLDYVSDTLDAKGEFLITLMSSLAEEESRSISENVKW